MSYELQTHRDIIDGNWYYFLYATRKWHLYAWVDCTMVKIAGNIADLTKAKEIAYKFAQIRKETNNGQN